MARINGAQHCFGLTNMFKYTIEETPMICHTTLSDFSMFWRYWGYLAVILGDEFLYGSVMTNHGESIAVDSFIHWLGSA